jgi:hypothetical protein
MTGRAAQVAGLGLAWACTPTATGEAGRPGGDYWPEGVREYEFIPEGQPESPSLRLRAEAGRWALRLDRDGDGWEASEPLAEVPVEARGEALWVDGVLLVPERLVEGATEGGLTVDALGEVEVWYGAFPDAFEGSTTEGRWGGDLAFAASFGPIRFTLDLVTWELASYLPASAP